MRHGTLCGKRSKRTHHTSTSTIGDYLHLSSPEFRRRALVWLRKWLRHFKAFFDEYDKGMLQRVWESVFKGYHQELRMFGGNDFEVDHTRVLPRKIKGA